MAEMMGLVKNCGLLYLVCPEDSTPGYKDLSRRGNGTRLLRAGKICLWLTVSILVGVVVSRLS